MSYNRINYDDSAYSLEINRSIGPGDYRLHKYFAENNNVCFSYDGPIGNKADVSLVNSKQYSDEMVQIESELSWRNHTLIKSNNNTTFPLKNTIVNKLNCSKELVMEDTRFTHPIDNYRCMSLTAYQYEPYLSINPQCHVQESTDRIGLNSRLHSKDTYIQPLQNFWDDGSSLPVAKPTNPEMKCYCTTSE